jgi:RimJ/RimL family protein N-acetyltransferase
MLHYPDLTDGTIALRPWTPDDAEQVHRMVQDPAIPRFMSIPPNHTLSGVQMWLGSRDEELQADQGVSLAIVSAGDGELLGSIGIELSCADAQIGEIGYWIGAGARGRGVASAAVRLIADWAYDTLGLARLEITTHKDNDASIRVALKCGFEREGLLRAYRLQHGKRVDLVMFSRIRGGHSRP